MISQRLILHKRLNRRFQMCYNLKNPDRFRRRTMKRITFYIGITFLILTLLCSCGHQKPKPAEKGDLHNLQAEYDILVRDLHSLNLINGLHLSGGQMKRMMPLVEESALLEKELADAKRACFVDFNKALVKIRTRLESHNDITEELQEELDRASLPLEKLEAKRRDRMKILSRQVLDILNDNQKFILNSYEPCMVPTPNISEPERIGGVIGAQEFGEQLDFMRKMPPDTYLAARKKLIDDKVRQMKVFNADFQIRSVVSQMEKAMDEARKMDDVEFQLNRDRLATVRMPPSKREGMEEEFASRYLLNPYLYRIFKNRTEKEKSGSN